MLNIQDHILRKYPVVK